MKPVFADAFFYLAVLNRDDAEHTRAMSRLEKGALEVVIPRFSGVASSAPTAEFGVCKAGARCRGEICLWPIKPCRYNGLHRADPQLLKNSPSTDGS